MQQAQVTTRTGTKKRYLLDPTFTVPLDASQMHLFTTPNKVPEALLAKFLKAPLLALDFETQGADASHPDFRSVGVSISDGEEALYVGLKSLNPEAKKKFLLKLAKRPLIMHNAFFDGAVFYKETGVHANIHWCTYGLSKQLSSESQELRWGLKGFQKELLGWTQTNELFLDEWLVNQGYHGPVPFKTELQVDERHPETKEPISWKAPAHKRYLKAGTDRWFVPDKGEMWKAPFHILGHYCNLDAYSTFLLFDQVLRPAMHKADYQVLKDYHYQDFLISVEILIENLIKGVTIDKEQLITYHHSLQDRIKEAKSSFMAHPAISEVLQSYSRDLVDNHRSREPSSPYKKRPALGKEPSPTTKAGDVSKNWIKWDERRRLLNTWETNPNNLRTDWKAWEEKRLALEAGTHEDGAFNVNSAENLKWLIYEKLGYKPLLFTKSGQPAVTGEALQLMGEELKSLATYKDLTKEETYVKACLDKIRLGADGLWRLHPQYNVPGPLTGRLAGAGGLNVQQLPKSYGYLSCWKPMQEDKVWIDCDHTALEPTVITELTRDPGMMKVYGPDAHNQDIYMFFGSQIPGIGSYFLDAGYDPDAPTKEGKDNAKKTCKHYRNICKTVVLAKQYRAGPKKIHQTLTNSKIDISFSQVEDICKSYDDTFKKVKEFSYQLEKEWRENGGWVFNGIGRPMTVAEDYLKDLVNRVVQSTGHDIHMMFLRIFKRVMLKEKIPYTWVIPDFHDQMILECKKTDAQKIKDLISSEVYARLNKELDGLIPITGGPEIVPNLAVAKELKP